MTDNGEDFEKLRKLLALKRHEQPPPGYFARLPDRITTRIELEASSPHSSWWGWLVSRFDARPLMACTCGVALGGLLLTGFQISQTMPVENAPAFTQAGPGLANSVNSLAFRPVVSSQSHYGAVAEANSSINPVFEPYSPERPHQLAGYGIQRVAFSPAPR